MQESRAKRHPTEEMKREMDDFLLFWKELTLCIPGAYIDRPLALSEGLVVWVKLGLPWFRVVYTYERCWTLEYNNRWSYFKDLPSLEARILELWG